MSPLSDAVAWKKVPEMSVVVLGGTSEDREESEGGDGRLVYLQSYMGRVRGSY